MRQGVARYDAKHLGKNAPKERKVAKATFASGSQIFLLSARHNISATAVPGSHPRNVSNNTRQIVPQPLSYTANGGKMTHKMIRMIRSMKILTRK